jgi:hypothetical protein
LLCVQQPAVIRPCCEEKKDFGLEFLRPCAIEETHPWLSEHRLLVGSCLPPAVYRFVFMSDLLSLLWAF